ncbi:glycerophosphodiester phosphodiesterase [Anaeromyxobacter sp. SG26]|uniref:glycerophosphodiester phosphodiesterase n=1 Tax=Anaeromyxobacter sp. SG26 TaxID=2925407 RepID=UPI001F56B040|nr:glycerophosphodiester phosphodiesterase family protein [Anaeromyxobacter sp. SG26]
MSWEQCTKDRAKSCAREKDEGYSRCTEQRDEGYSECTQTRDDGFRRCCDWAPCSWFCRAWVWVSHIVCVIWTWISNIVCVAWTWVANVVCVLWVYATAPVCLAIGKLILGLDGLLRWGLATFGSIVAGIIDFVFHPVESIGTIGSLLGGCPSARANEPGPLQIIAHHGAPLELPENTIQSCARALTLKANAVEIDLCMTADGEVVLWHDWHPDDVVSLTRQLELGQGDVAFKPHVPPIGSAWRKPTVELTLEEFRAHYSYLDERDPVDRIKWQIAHGPVDPTIPTLGEFFSATREWPSLRTVYLDVKMPSASALLYAGRMMDQIDASVRAGRRGLEIVIMVPDPMVLRVMKTRAHEQGYSQAFTWDVEFPAGIVLNPAKFSAVAHATSSQFHNSVASVGRPTVATLFPWRVYRRTIDHDVRRRDEVNADPGTLNAGVEIAKLVAWTINDPDEMRCLATMGVTGIITDRISDLAGVASSVGRL